MVTRVQDNGLANVTAALDAFASRARHLQWGTGSGKAANANALTTTGTTEARALGTSSRQTTTKTNDTFRVVASLVAAAPRTITEAGLFDQAGTGSPPTGGDMCVYADFAAIGLEAGDTLELTFNVVVAAS